MKILRVSCGPRGQDAESYRLSQEIVGCLLRSEPTAILVDRVIGDGQSACSIKITRSPTGSSADVSQEGSPGSPEVLIPELESSDVVVSGTPYAHNFTVPSALKSVERSQVVRARRTFNVTPEGKVGTLPRPAGLHRRILRRKILRRAGASARFSASHLKAVLGIIGLHDPTFFSVQGTGSSARCCGRDQERDSSSAARIFFFIFRLGSKGHLIVAPEVTKAQRSFLLVRGFEFYSR